MKYDSIQRVETVTRPSDSVSVKKAGRIKRFKAVDFVILQLGICIVANIAFMLFTIFTQYEPQSIAEIFNKIISVSGEMTI